MGLSSKLWVIFIAALPVSELRGAVPYGISKGLPWLEVFILAVIGNLLPVIPVFLFRLMTAKAYIFNKIINYKK